MLQDLARAARSVVTATHGSIVRLDSGRHGAAAVIASKEHLIANAHSVDGEVVALRTMDGRAVEARVAGVDPDGDLAVLAASDVGSPLSFADEAVTVGTPVFAVGVGHGRPRVTFGLVSGVDLPFVGPRGRRISGAIEHTAPLAPGSSGSALVDVRGHLVGINTSRLGSGFYLALPADQAFQARVARLVTGGAVGRPRLGIAIAPAWMARRMRAAVGLRPRDGLLVREVEPGSPAEAAGMMVGDLLVAIDGRTVTGPDELADAVDAAPEALSIGLVRGETELTVTARLGGG